MNLYPYNKIGRTGTLGVRGTLNARVVKSILANPMDTVTPNAGKP